MLEYERITNYTLCFDVEKKYKTIDIINTKPQLCCGLM